MNNLSALITELCPNGVEYKELQAVLKIKNGSDYKSFGEGDIPVYGSGGIIAHTNRFAYDKPSVLIPRKGSVDKLYYVDVPFWNVDTIFYTEINTGLVIPRYVYHCLLREHLEKLNTAGGVPSLTQNVLNKVKIPVPPLEVQREIIRILDSFADLTSELTENLSMELTARKQQYEYYRNKLLDKQQSSTKIITIGELGAWSGGKTPSMDNSDYWENGTIPWISSKDMKASTLEDTDDHITEQAVNEAAMTVYPANGIAVVTRSGILKHTLPVAFVPFETTVNQDIKMLTVYEGVLPRYAFHAIQGKSPDILTKAKKQGGTVDSLEFKKFLDYKIPLPSLAVQKRLVEVLDNFDAICSDLNIGLPAEIEARKKQYEFYRDQLLTFAVQDEIVLTDRQTDEYNALIRLCQYVFGYFPVKLSDISVNCDSQRKPVTSANREAGDIPYYGASGIVDHVKDYIFDGNYLLISEDGANLLARNTPIAFSISGKTWVNNHAHILRFDNPITQKYVEIYLNAIDLSPYISGGAQPKLNQQNLYKIPIPLPPFQRQKEIVEILDHFSTLCTDLTSGLPAEIEARQKQYEYYRDKLLSFTPAD